MHQQQQHQPSRCAGVACARTHGEQRQHTAALHRAAPAPQHAQQQQRGRAWRHPGVNSNSSRLLIMALLMLLLVCPVPAAAYRQSTHLIQPAAVAASSARSSSTRTSSSRAAAAAPPPPLHSAFNSEASMQIAARQALFDYAVTQALAILDAAVRGIAIPAYHATLEVPVIGGIDVTISAVNITDLRVPRELARVAIESGYYHLRAANMTAQITFDWAWSKGPLSGAGNGALALEGGSLDEIFLVRNQEDGVPQLVAVSSAVGFGALDLSIHSYSADWLYQALLYIFSGVIQRQIEEAVNNAVHTDVPAGINGLLDSLPAKVSIQGLPFDAVFTYAVYTLNYVIVKGYGEVAVPPEPAPSTAAQPSALAASMPPQHTGGAASSPAAAATPVQQLLRQDALGQGACPFPAGPLPLTPAEIGSESSMFSAYFHEAVPNCVLWGLHRSGALNTVVRDGNIPQLRLITDLFGGLIPELPKHYPKRGMLLNIVVTKPPTVHFNNGADGGVRILARYDTNVSVLNATGDGADLLVASLTANVSLAADFGWDATRIVGTNVSYAVINQTFPVNVGGWNQIIDWVAKQAGPRQSLGKLWDTYVRTPATPYIGLANVATRALDGWFVVSSDVKVTQLPPLPSVVMPVAAQ